MKTTGNTILLTGGTSGIGLALAKQFKALGNTFIVTGRNQTRLASFAHEHPSLHAIQSDVCDPVAIASLHKRVSSEFPALNVLINNAGIMRKLNLQDGDTDLGDITREVETNLMGPIRMVKQFLPQLRLQSCGAIVNVSSGLAFTPMPISPIYCATKAGVHSFAQSLRVQLKNTNIEVFELAPPATDTSLFEAFDPADNKGIPLMNGDKLAREAIKGMQANRREILPGLSKVLRLMSRVAPSLGVKSLSGRVDAMLSQAS